MKEEIFILTMDHLRLITRLNIGISDGPYANVPIIDSQKPFGDEYWRTEICKILHWCDKDSDPNDVPVILKSAAEAAMTEVTIALEICITTLTFKPGTYVKFGRIWNLKK